MCVGLAPPALRVLGEGQPFGGGGKKALLDIGTIQTWLTVFILNSK